MRNVLLALLALAFAATAFHAGAEYDVLETPCKVTAATVFNSGALVTRTADVELPAGVTVVKVNDLPPAVNPSNTIVEGAGDFTIVANEIRDTWVEKPVSEKVKKLMAKREELDRRIAEGEAKAKQAEEDLNFYRKMTPAFPSTEDLKDFSTLDTDGCKRFLETVEKGMSAASRKLLELRAELKKLKAERDAVVNQLKQLGGKQRFRYMLVTVKASKPTAARLDITSLVGGCSWRSNYDTRLLDGKTCEINYYADVIQRTGEDWKGVRLTLSTTDISSLVLPPVLKRWAMTLVQTAPKEDKKAAPEKPAANSILPGAPAPRPQAGHAGARSVTAGGGVAVEFKIDKPTDIQSGSARRLLVRGLTFHGSLKYLVMPRIKPFAFTVFETSNDSAYPLLPGNMRVFTGNELLGRTSFPLVVQGAKMKLYFGADPSVEVKYRPIKRKVDVGRKTQEIDFEWIFEITNRRPSAASFEVVDALPRPGMDEIKVRSVRMKPRPDNDPDEEPYRLARWKFTLESGAKKEISVAFKLKAPSDMELQWEGPWNGGVR